MKLNLGAGAMHLAGWQNIDINARSASERLDLAVRPWPFAANSADEILASHILEHFTKAEGRAFLAECHRIPRPGGVLHLAVPDMDVFVECRLSGDWSPVGGYAWTDLNHFMGGDGGELFAENKHRYMYTFESLAYALGCIGFRSVKRRAISPLDNSDHVLFSLYLDAVR